MLQASQLRKTYGAITPVKGLTFSMGEGEVAGLLGVNGAGKSTTMRMLSGYLAPTSGNIVLDGFSMVEDPLRAKALVGYLPETPPLYPDMTVREQLRFICALRSIPARRVRAECDRVASLLNIGHVLNRLNGHLSKGYRQRVGFAAALVGSPRLVILDEPTSGLDPHQMIDIRALIQELTGSTSVLISSHVLSEIENVCTRLLILVEGALVTDGTPADILAAYGKAPRLELDVLGDARAAEQVLRALLPADVTWTRVATASGEGTGFAIPLSGISVGEERFFAAFAGQNQALAVTRMVRVLPTLEEAFLDITLRASVTDAKKEVSA